VLYFADFKTITQKSEEYFNHNHPRNVGEIVKILIKKYPQLKNILLEAKTNKIKDTISIAINHSIIKNPNPRSESLQKDDILAFLLPISGG